MADSIEFFDFVPIKNAKGGRVVIEPFVLVLNGSVSSRGATLARNRYDMHGGAFMERREHRAAAFRERAARARGKASTR